MGQHRGKRYKVKNKVIKHGGVKDEVLATGVVKGKERPKEI